MVDDHYKVVISIDAALKKAIFEYEKEQFDLKNIVKESLDVPIDLPDFGTYIKFMISKILQDNNLEDAPKALFDFLHNYSIGYHERGVEKDALVFAVSSVVRPSVEYGIGLLDDALNKRKNKNTK